MAKRPAKTKGAAGFDAYSARRFVDGHRSRPDSHDKTRVWPVWAIAALGMLVFAGVIGLIT